MIVVTRCQILTLKCTKFDSGWGSAPYPAGEMLYTPTPTTTEWAFDAATDK